MCESGINYKVSFNIGINKYGRIAAFNIKLLDLPKIQDTPQEEEMDEGYITEYDSKNPDKGYNTCCGGLGLMSGEVINPGDIDSWDL